MKTSQIADQLLIDLLLKKDRQAFEFLYDTYSPALHGSIIDIVASKELAADVLQKAFVMAYNTISDYDHRKQRLFTWMLHISRRIALEILHSINRWPKASELIEISGGMRSLLCKMSPGQKRVIELMYYKGLSKTQVAQLMNISIETTDELLQTGLYQLEAYISNRA
jgi:RNA polymerase sigma-70 factor (ECF subfamily)